jgi:hypothetical protein
MISFADQFGELEDCVYKDGEPYIVRVSESQIQPKVVIREEYADVTTLSDCKQKFEKVFRFEWKDGCAPCDPTAERNPLAAMCNYRNTHSTERLPAKPEAKPAPHGIMAVTVADWRLGAWK